MAADVAVVGRLLILPAWGIEDPESKLRPAVGGPWSLLRADLGFFVVRERFLFLLCLRVLVILEFPAFAASGLLVTRGFITVNLSQDSFFSVKDVGD